MSLFEYEKGRQFETVLQAAMRLSDSDNFLKLKSAFPDSWEELQLRYNSPDIILESDR